MKDHIRVMTPWVAFFLMFWVVLAEANPRRAAARLRSTVQTLTQAEWQGRATGHGALSAGQWLEEQMKKMGLEPAGQDGFQVRVSVPTQMSRAATFQFGERTFALDHEFEVLPWSDSAVVEGPLIFAGYGLSAPHLGWDDYADLDVDGRAVLVLTGLPTSLDGKLKATDEHLQTLESKSAVALAHRARAVIFVNDPRTHGYGEGQRPDILAEARTNRALEGIAAVRSRLEPVDGELRSLGLDLRADQRPSFSTPIRLNVEVKRTFHDAVNLVGKVPGGQGRAMILAAHYDGLPKDMAETHYTGADDNASGVAVVLEVAARLVKNPPTQTTYVIFHDAEELGLHGARRTAHWLREQGVSGHLINLDMVGRLRDPGLRVHAMGEDCLSVRKLAEKDLLKIVCDRPQGSPSDHWPYLNVGFSAVSLTTGRSVDYHTRRDTMEHLNFSGMVVIADLLEDMARTQRVPD